MSRIEDLIAKHCPNGVEYSEVSNVMEKVRSKGKLPRSKYEESGLIEVIDQGQDLIAAYSSDLSIANPPAKWILFGDHTRTVKWWEGSFVQGADGLVPLHVKIPGNPKFYYYAMKNLDITNRGYNRHWSVVKDMKLPAPPLEVQDEIVRILDSYTQLETNLESELEAELEARRKQYEYYRESLLSVENLSDYPGYQLKLMEEVAEIRSGWGFPKKYQGISSGEIPFFKVSDMNTEGNTTEISIANNYVSECVGQKLKLNPAPAQTIIFPKVGAAIRTNKKRITAQLSAYDNNIMGLIVTDKTVMPKYLFHWMQTVDLSTIASDSGAVPSITKAKVEKIKVPVPPLSEQERIVVILDKFDALVNDLSSGLPAEIEARRKQYEYYRDQLLTFTPAK